MHALTHPRSRRLSGPDPKVDGRGLAPLDVWGHDVLWWLDRMVRTRGAARRAHDARLARLVRHEQGGRGREVDAAPERAAARPRARQLPLAAARRDQGPGDADLAQRDREPRGRAERELRPRAAGAVHARRRPRLHRARRAPDGAGAHRLARGLARRRRARRLPLRPRAPRPQGDADLRQARPLRLARRGRPRGAPRQAPELLRHQAVELLHPHPAAARHAARARAALQAVGARHPPGGRRHPQAPRAPHRPAHGQAADRLHRGPAARARPRDRHRLLVVARPR